MRAKGALASGTDRAKRSPKARGRRRRGVRQTAPENAVGCCGTQQASSCHVAIGLARDVSPVVAQRNTEKREGGRGCRGEGTCGASGSLSPTFAADELRNSPNRSLCEGAYAKLCSWRDVSRPATRLANRHSAAMNCPIELCCPHRVFCAYAVHREDACGRKA